MNLAKLCGAKGTLVRLGTAAALLALAAPVVAGTVVASSGPSAAQYRVGSQVSNSQRITLISGDSVTVLDSGSTRVLRGPGTFVLARRSGAASNNAFAALTGERTATRGRVASSRGTPPTNPNLWYVDIDRSGTICMNDLANVRLWRADADAAQQVSITTAGQAAVLVSFPQKEGVASWSASAPPREGVTYSIGATEVTFKLIANVPTNAEAMAQALIENGCTVQLEQLAAATMART